MAGTDQLPDEEAARRRDEVVKRMLATPPKPHKPLENRRNTPKPRA